MKLLNCQQGSPEWLQARAGCITASNFAEAISMVDGLTPQQKLYVDAIRDGKSSAEAGELAGYKTAVKPTETVKRAIEGLPVGRPSDASDKYAGDVALERISMLPYGEPPKAWVLERGHILEEDARMAYEWRTGNLASGSGIYKTDDDWFGYSADGSVRDDGLIEVKCPIDSKKIEAMWDTGDVSEYIHQMQGGMWITGRLWCDFIMYVPALKAIGQDLFVKRVMRDDNFIDDMVNRLTTFRLAVMAKEAKFRRGIPANSTSIQLAA